MTIYPLNLSSCLSAMSVLLLSARVRVRLASGRLSRAGAKHIQSGPPYGHERTKSTAKRNPRKLDRLWVLQPVCVAGDPALESPPFVFYSHFLFALFFISRLSSPVAPLGGGQFPRVPATAI